MRRDNLFSLLFGRSVLAFLHAHQLTDTIIEVLKARPSYAAVAYWGAEAITRLELDDDLHDLTIFCDLFSGCCNPKTLRGLMSRGARVLNAPRLHAKVYLGNGMVVCSANASTNGLAEEDKEAASAIEAGIFSSDPSQIRAARAWLSALEKHAETVTSADLLLVDDLWKARRRDRPVRPSNALSPAELILKDPNWFDERPLKVAVYETSDPPKNVERAYKATPFFDAQTYESQNDYPFFWKAKSWGVRAGDLILCIEVDGRVVSCDGVWRALDQAGRLGVIPLRRESQIFGMTLTRRDRNLLARSALASIRAEKLDRNAGIMTVADFQRAVVEA